MDTEPQTVYDLLNDPPRCATAVANFCDWSTNHDYPRPFVLFLDIIGYSDEEYGEPMFNLNKCAERFGYMEIGKLADALNEYALNPRDVREYVNKIMAADES